MYITEDPFTGICVMSFLILDWGYGFFGGRPQSSKVPFLAHCIRGPCCQHYATGDVNLDHLAELVFVEFLPCGAIFCFPLPVLSCLEEGHSA